MQWLEGAPGWVHYLLSPAVLIGLSVFSAFTFLASLIGASWAVQRLPPDYLLHDPRPAHDDPGGYRPGLVLRNALGAVLLILGVLMLFLPGQGLLTILAALGVMDFRGKRRLEHWLLLRPKVLEAINRLRQRSGHPPLVAPLGERGPMR